jgi:hypothetical protein
MGTAGLDETQMSRRNLGIAGEIELAQPPALPPFAQEVSHRVCTIEHTLTLARTGAALKLPRR